MVNELNHLDGMVSLTTAQASGVDGLYEGVCWLITHCVDTLQRYVANQKGLVETVESSR